jgi:hypothetical protein
MVSDIQLYPFALADNLAGFIMGGIPAAVYLVIERLRNKPFSPRVFASLFLVFGFFAASSQTWRDEHTERLALQSSQHWERSPEVSRRLQQMYAEVSDFNRRAYSAMTGSEDDFKEPSSTVARLCGVETALCYPLRLGG